MTWEAARPETQAASAVLMVRPAAFASNPQTALSNTFQAVTARTPEIQRRAEREFDAAVACLEQAGIRVHAFAGRSDCDAPDEIFPNNWVSFHADGTAVLYPMLAPNRRLERRASILAALERDHGYRLSRLIDLTEHEIEGRYLEGTGSLVLDRINRLAYACGSPRTDLDALADFADRLGFQPVVFAATDATNRPVYHTNVLMSLGSRFAVICLDAITDAAARTGVAQRLEESGRELIALSFAQMHNFAANILELRSNDHSVIALSSQARETLDNAQVRALERYGELVATEIPTIEAYGGGSLRCMLAEIHLARTADVSAN
jgi:hypothetical protein